MSVKVVFDPDFPVLFEADPVTALQLMETIMVEGDISDNTTTSFTLSASFPDGSIVGTVTGSGFTYDSSTPELLWTGGTIQTLDLSIVVPSFGSFDAFSVTNINTAYDDIIGALIDDRTGTDDTALEDFFLGFDWDFTLNESNGDADSTYILGDGEVEFNMKGDDVIYGLGGRDKLYLGDGNDKAFGGNGADVLEGGAGRDILKGGAGKDKLIGGTGADRLDGNRGDDTMLGGAGNDRLFNSSGSDTFVGGNGKDTFIFHKQADLISSGDLDTIRGFQQGNDTIDLAGIDANVNSAQNSVFVFIGDREFGDKARQLRVEDLGTSQMIQGDVDGDGEADFEIEVTNFNGTFLADDFIL